MAITTCMKFVNKSFVSGRRIGHANGYRICPRHAARCSLPVCWLSVCWLMADGGWPHDDAVVSLLLLYGTQLLLFHAISFLFLPLHSMCVCVCPFVVFYLSFLATYWGARIFGRFKFNMNSAVRMSNANLQFAETEERKLIC